MNRRNFVHHLGLLGLASAAAPVLASATTSATADPIYNSFEAALKHQPALSGWVNASDRPPQRLKMTGKLPKGLRGTLFRNGPGLFSRDGRRVPHWFAGDGLIQAWRMDDDGISHQARFVRTHKFRQEEQAGRFLYNNFGFKVKGAKPVRNNDSINTGNISVLPVKDELWALWEAGSPWVIDPDNLETHGTKAFRNDLAGIPFSAHPLVDTRGQIWNVAALNFFNVSKLGVWHLSDAGKLRRFELVDIPYPGYIHSFSMTANYIIAVIAPWIWAGVNNSKGPGLWQPDGESVALIIDKRTLSVVKQHRFAAGMAYHWADAWETDQGVTVRGCWVDNIEPLDNAMMGMMRGDLSLPGLPTDWLELRLPLRAGEPQLLRHKAGDVEFPYFLPHEGKTPGHVFTLRKVPGAMYLNAIQCINAEQAVCDWYDFGKGALVEEPVFVPHQNLKHDRDGWLLVTRLDPASRTHRLAILQADRLSEGPLVEAVLPQPMPLTFHGVFNPNISPINGVFGKKS